MKVVLDNNIIISAFLFKGSSLDFLKKLTSNNKVTLITSKEIIEELIKVLKYPKFGLSKEQIRSIADWYLENTLCVYVDKELEIVTSDRSDNKFLSCALEGGVDYIISGDRHLLALNSFSGIPIVRQSEFSPPAV